MNVALQVLGHPGLHVTVFDPDIITEANIGRQLFSETELGQCKATEQFEISDQRSPEQVVCAIRGAGLEPVWKDWDSGLDVV